MSDVQLALLILGLIVILIMIIHNWAQIRQHNKRKEKLTNGSSPQINEDNDPLFQSAEFDITEQANDLNISSEGSAKVIKDNLPEGIFPEIETVASITCKKTFNTLENLFIDRIKGIKGARLYIRNDNDIWTTDLAIEEGIRFNQILIVQQLASREGSLSNVAVADISTYVNDVNNAVDGTLFWLFNQDISIETKKLSDFCKEVDRAMSIKVIPKSDSAFHPAALIDFFKNPSINKGEDNIHRLINANNSEEIICEILNLSGKPLELNHESFIQGIVFKMDVPNTLNITHAFNEMIRVMREACTNLNGSLVDVGNKPMNDDYVSRVYVYLKNVEQKMLTKNITPGGELAKKIFS